MTKLVNLQIMTKVKYYYDKKSLSYKEINLTLKQKIQNLLLYILSASIITSLSFFIFYSFFDSPKEKKLKSEINFLTSNYQKFESKLLEIETVLDDIQKREEFESLKKQGDVAYSSGDFEGAEVFYSDASKLFIDNQIKYK